MQERVVGEVVSQSRVADGVSFNTYHYCLQDSAMPTSTIQAAVFI